MASPNPPIEHERCQCVLASFNACLEYSSAMLDYWVKVGKPAGYRATFIVCGEERCEPSTMGLRFELIDYHNDEDFEQQLSTLFTRVLSQDIYSIQLTPLKDKIVQLGMINGPILIKPAIDAPWIHAEDDRSKPAFSLSPAEPVNCPMQVDAPQEAVAPAAETNANVKAPSAFQAAECAAEPASKAAAADEPIPKKMKMVKVPRTFMENGYQMTEMVNELVPCDEGEVAEDPKPNPGPKTTTAKQGTLLNFFKKK